MYQLVAGLLGDVVGHGMSGYLLLLHLESNNFYFLGLSGGLSYTRLRVSFELAKFLHESCDAFICPHGVVATVRH